MIELRFWERVRYIEQGTYVSTDGLGRKGHSDLTIQVDDRALVKGAKEFLRFVVNYLNKSGRKILAGETLNYGYWLVKFMPGADGRLETWEYNAEATEFFPGGSLAVRYWQEQHAACRRYNAIFAPPNLGETTVISAGVMEGLPVCATRYPWRDPFSGWLVLTDKFNGDTKTLSRHHTYHLTANRPELARYLALPPGFGFDLRNKVRVFYDEKALREDLGHYFGEQACIDAGLEPPGK